MPDPEKRDDDETDGCEADMETDLTTDEEVAALLIDEEPPRTEAQWEHDDAV